jgi:hypothetical protein
VNPLWLAGIVFIGGSLIALWPDAREARLAERYADGGAHLTAALVVGAVLAVACVVLVALPFLREPAARDDRLSSPDDSSSAAPASRKNGTARLPPQGARVRPSHRQGLDDDYRRLVGPLRQHAAQPARPRPARRDAADERVPTVASCPNGSNLAKKARYCPQADSRRAGDT